MATYATEDERLPMNTPKKNDPLTLEEIQAASDIFFP